jgi:hypothetical protein
MPDTLPLAGSFDQSYHHVTPGSDAVGAKTLDGATVAATPRLHDAGPASRAPTLLPDDEPELEEPEDEPLPDEEPDDELPPDEEDPEAPPEEAARDEEASSLAPAPPASDGAPPAPSPQAEATMTRKTQPIGRSRCIDWIVSLSLEGRT